MKVPKLYEKYQIYNGKCGFQFISPDFVQKNKAEGNLEAIKDLYMFKHCLYDMIWDETDKDMISSLGKDVVYIELEIQRLFNFKPSLAYIRFWETPTCSCPYFDNMDLFGVDQYVINKQCPVHGEDGLSAD